MYSIGEVNFIQGMHFPYTVHTPLYMLKQFFIAKIIMDQGTLLIFLSKGIIRKKEMLELDGLSQIIQNRHV